MMIGIFFFSDAAELILCKQFIHTKRLWNPEKFISCFKSNNFSFPLAIEIEDVTYFHIACDKVYLTVGLEDKQVSSFLILEYLEKTVNLLKDFLGTLTEKTIQANISLVYEVFSETTNAGHPKLVDAHKLKPFLCSSILSEKKDNITTSLLNLMPESIFGTSSSANKQVLPHKAKDKPLQAITRKEPKSTEIFIDLIENLCVVVDATGLLLYYSVQGKLEVKSYLQSVTNVAISFKQIGESSLANSVLKNAVLHPNIPKQGSPNNLQVVAAPGTTHVMQYCTLEKSEASSLPFTLFSNITPFPEDKLLAINLKLHCNLPPRHPALNVTCCLNLPLDTFTASGSSTLASMEFEYDKTRNIIKFSTPLFPGESHHSISAKVILTVWSPAMVYEMSSVTLNFEVPMWCQSNLTIGNIRVVKTNTGKEDFPVQVDKWVRYLTYSSSYEFYLRDNWLACSE